jgi:hypothetical protein
MGWAKAAKFVRIEVWTRPRGGRKIRRECARPPAATPERKMPQFVVSNNSQVARYAKFVEQKKGVKVSWGTMDEATGFASAEEARAKFLAACEGMLKEAADAAQKDLASGAIVKHGSRYATGGYSEKWTVENGKLSALELRAPQWLIKAQSQLASFPIAQRTTAEDFLNRFDVYYARSSEGWLCRPQRAAEYGRYTWSENFSLAVPFNSPDAARAEIRRWANTRDGGGHVVSCSCVLGDAKPEGKPQPDPIATRIAMANEARDIQSAIDQAANERIAALAEKAARSEGEAQGLAAPAAPRSRPRL